MSKNTIKIIGFWCIVIGTILFIPSFIFINKYSFYSAIGFFASLLFFCTGEALVTPIK